MFNKPFVWYGLTAAQRERLWAHSAQWFDQEMQRMRERQREQREAKRRPLPEADAPQEPLRCDDCPGGEACGMLDRCPSTTPNHQPNTLLNQIRQRRCGERLVRLVLAHADQLRPALLAMIAEDLGKITAKIVDSKRRK
jgi:hypothetical protein